MSSAEGFSLRTPGCLRLLVVPLACAASTLVSCVFDAGRFFGLGRCVFAGGVPLSLTLQEIV